MEMAAKIFSSKFAEIDHVLKKLKSLEFRELISLWRDLLTVFDVKYYKSSGGTLQKFFPRTHFYLFGLFKQMQTNAIFNPRIYKMQLSPSSIGARFPLLHYLHFSRTYSTLTDWDIDYLTLRPDVVIFRRSPLVHYFRYGLLSENLRMAVEHDYLNSARNTQMQRLVLSQTYKPLSAGSPKSVLNLELILDYCSQNLVVFSDADELNSKFLPLRTRQTIHQISQQCQGYSPVISITFADNSLQIYLTLHRRCLIDLNTIRNIVVGNVSEIAEEMIEEVLANMLNNYISKSQNYLEQFEHLVTVNGQIELPLPLDFRNSTIGSMREVKILAQMRGLECSQSKRILIISHEDTFTGAPIFASQIAMQLETEGYDVSVLVLREDKQDGMFVRQNLRVNLLSDFDTQVFGYRWLMHDWKLTGQGKAALHRAIKHIRPNLVILNTLASSDAIETVVREGVPSILYVHENWKTEDFKKGTNEIFAMQVVNGLMGASTVLFGSSAAASNWSSVCNPFRSQTLSSWRVPSSTESNLDESERRRVRTSLSLTDLDFLILSIATFEPRKRIEDLIAAFDLVTDPNVHLLIIGRTPGIGNSYEQDIDALVRELPNVTILNASADLSPFYLASDIFLFASEQEVFPLVLQEAAWFGLPRVVSEYPGIAEMIPDETLGFVYPVGDVGSAARKIEILIADKQLRTSMRTKALDFQKIATQSSFENLINLIEITQTQPSIICIPETWI